MMRRKQAGFTLMELLVSLALLSVLSTLGTVTFIMVMDGWNTVEVGMALNSDADNVLDAFQDEFGQVMASALSGQFIRGEKIFFEVPAKTGMARIESRVTLPISAMDVGSGRRRNVDVSYRMGTDEEGKPALMQAVSALGAPIPEDAFQAWAPGAGVRAMRVEYQDAQGQWQDDWSANSMPDAVRMSLVFCDANRNYEQIARTAVFAVPVR